MTVADKIEILDAMLHQPNWSFTDRPRYSDVAEAWQFVHKFVKAGDVVYTEPRTFTVVNQEAIIKAIVDLN